MSGETLYERPRKHNVSATRTHDYLYDSNFIVCSARDYARTAFKAAMESAQVVVQPIYKTMFSELKKYPRFQFAYHPNCRLPVHIDSSYGGYVQRVSEGRSVPTPQLIGKDRFKFSAVPKKVLMMHSTSPDFHPPTPIFSVTGPGRPKNKGTQSQYRESSAQTIPWQPDAKAAECCEQTPEVLYLDKLQWGPGCPFRTGDLPADFHTTEIINKMRHARVWTEVSEGGDFPRWMKKRDAIITDVETEDWIFREAEIDELQGIRLELLHRVQAQLREKHSNRTSKKLANLWALKKQEMERKIDVIRRTRDREIRKLNTLHSGGGRNGLVTRMRASRGAGSMTAAAIDPASDLHAPLARNGYQARKRHVQIRYDPTLLSFEDHEAIEKPPSWLEQCAQDFTKSCSGHYLPRDPAQLCERETKWSEQFLENLHNDLKKIRLGAAAHSAGPLHILKPKRVASTPRPVTPVVDAVGETEELNHQAALTLQRIIRGRAVQILMYEGRRRAAELTEELKTTHGLQREDKARIAHEEAKAREYNALRTEAEQKEDAIAALVDELCGGAVSAALEFLEKELRRLKEERRHHAFMLIALREKTMREAAEAGRRQKEEHRRREHDEMFRTVLGVTQETVDAYLKEIVLEGVELAAEEEAVKNALARADNVDLKANESMSTAEENELVAELVQQFLLPHVHKTAARHRITSMQKARLDAARDSIFGIIDDAEIRKDMCTRCGSPLDEQCRCRSCPVTQEPKATVSRDDWRWKHSRRRAQPPPKTHEERYPAYHDLRCMLNTVVDEAVVESRRRRTEEASLKNEWGRKVREAIEITLDSRQIVADALDQATGVVSPPLRAPDTRFYLMRVVGDALDRTEPYPTTPCPKVLPSEVRRNAEAKAKLLGPICHCKEEVASAPKEQLEFRFAESFTKDTSKVYSPELRMLEELRRCKCDIGLDSSSSYDFTDDSEVSSQAAVKHDADPGE